MNRPVPRTFQTQSRGQEIHLSVGELAPQADAAVTCRWGDTTVLATVVMNDRLREGIDYMPLLVEYEEKFYAAGKIKGSRFVKREGRPTDLAVTTSRMIDRSIRPLFPKRMRNDVHVVTTVLSYDGEHPSDIAALVAASAALAVSRVPWEGPLGAVRVGRIHGAWLVNPTISEFAASDGDLVVAATTTEAVMLEAGGREIPDSDLFVAIDVATKEAAALAQFVASIVRDVGAPKTPPALFAEPAELRAAISAAAQARVEEILRAGGPKLEMEEKFTKLHADIVATLHLTGDAVRGATAIIHTLHRDTVREWILTEGRRVNGRKPDEIRPLRAVVGPIPRTHGSAIFERGETQILSTVTLGAPDDAQILDSMTEEDTKKRFFHFYNMPAFSVGEISPNRGPGRRDIGHGALAERAVAPLIPSREKFPYTVMAVSEVLSSNGSSSMGSACGTSLALMDAGVPLAASVAGIAMGLVTDETNRGRAPVVLTDIAGMEDEGCDMDFKVAGTRNGVTALQVDIKAHGLPRAVIEEALLGARRARVQILDVMQETIPAPRPELSPYAPRILTVKINPAKIADLIGPRGKHINQIIEETGVEIDVEDSGLVSLTGKDAQAIEKARAWVAELTREVQVGEQFVGRVTRLMKFGAFVELFSGTEGLVHISELSPTRVNRVEDVVHIGKMIPVVVMEIDSQGRINLSHKRAKTG